MKDNLFTKATVERSDKGLVAVASTSVVDRQGEVVSVDGWDLKNFKKNPVLLWGHDHSQLPIGNAKNIKVDGVGKKARLIFEPVFHEITDTAKAIKTMFEEGILNSFSVGFKPVDMDGNTYTRQELLEISAVNVPANPEARVMAYKSLKDAGYSEKVMSELGLVDKDAEIEALKAEIKDLSDKYDEVVKGLKHLNPSGREKTVVTERLALSKVVARASDKLLEQKPKGDTAILAKVIKRASEQLIVDHKQELKVNGKN